MKKLNILNLFLLIVAFSFASCSDGLQGNIPECLEDEFKILKNNSCESGASLKLFQFQGASVYLFDIGLCISHSYSEVYNENCELLGTLGTIAGFDSINGEKFHGNATDEVILWSN